MKYEIPLMIGLGVLVIGVLAGAGGRVVESTAAEPRPNTPPAEGVVESGRLDDGRRYEIRRVNVGTDGFAGFDTRWSFVQELQA